ncbi:hypothetical protein [Paenibacillus alginolyticus]|nr:hypothetical protein [Paenibacillus alginolyticus]
MGKEDNKRIITIIVVAVILFSLAMGIGEDGGTGGGTDIIVV